MQFLSRITKDHSKYKIAIDRVLLVSKIDGIDSGGAFGQAVY